MNTAVIELGSNIDSDGNINKALQILREEQNVISVSKFVETEPIGFTDQDNFTNGSVLVSTSLDYDELVKYCKSVETRLGRVRLSNKYGPRTIDLDIIIWNGSIINKDFYERDFVRSSVNEVYPLDNIGSEKNHDNS